MVDPLLAASSKHVGCGNGDGRAARYSVAPARYLEDGIYAQKDLWNAKKVLVSLIDDADLDCEVA